MKHHNNQGTARRAPTADRRKLLGALFAEAAKRNIDQDELRDVIAPEYLGKRLSKSSDFEINKLRNHITGFKPKWNKYPASLAGLKQEVCDLARARWGETWEASLNAFCKKFGAAKWQWLNVRHAVAIKRRLTEMQKGEK